MTQPEQITPPDGNVFVEFGFPPGGARNLMQLEAVRLMRVNQPRISDVVRGPINQSTIDSLINMLAYAGVPVGVRAAGNAA